ncbi:MAG TPA: helix-turn-helix domain-containing protein, partial [Amycolatopsis sp.]|nr:helix-turn-helix domain-containing protein [Amycolatopsis sp.]
MAKQDRSGLTRQAIIEGAARVFEKKGYDGTSLADVIAEAHVTKGALYFHFESKRDLANAVITLQHGRSITPAQDHLGTDARGLEAVIHLSQHMARQLVDDPIVRAGSRLTLETGTF